MHQGPTISIFVFMFALDASCAETIAYKDTRFGIPVKQFQAKNPDFHCPELPAPLMDCLSASGTYAGISVIKARAAFVDGMLSHVDLSMVEDPEEHEAISAFRTIEEALISKYGQPIRTTDNVTTLGRVISFWESNGLSIQLTRSKNERGSRVHVMMGRDDHLKRSVEIRKSKAKKDI